MSVFHQIDSHPAHTIPYTEDSLCYVETKNLDGETNLKIKRGVGRCKLDPSLKEPSFKL